jgi:CBS domain-containing protein
MSVGKACTRNVVTVHPEETVHAAAKRMAHHEVGTLVVVDGNRPVGMLTDRDLVIRVMAKEPLSLPVLVREVMTPEPVCISEHLPLAEAVVRMRGHQVRRLVVVNDAQAVVGLVSLDDVLLLLGAEQQAVAGLMRAARRHRA